MNAYRERSLSRGHLRRRQRPPWLIALIIAVGAVAMAGLGFGLSVLLHPSPSTDALVGPSSSASPRPCKTTMVSPAEVLPRTDKVKINVYNSTGRVGLATDTAKVLSARGFKIQDVDNDPTKQMVAGVAEIRYGPKGAAGAQLLSFYIPGAVMIGDSRTGRVIDVALGQEYKKLNGEAEIAAAMASPSPSMSGEGCVSGSAATAPSVPVASGEPSPGVSPSP